MPNGFRPVQEDLSFLWPFIVLFRKRETTGKEVSALLGYDCEICKWLIAQFGKKIVFWHQLNFEILPLNFEISARSVVNLHAHMKAKWN